MIVLDTSILVYAVGVDHPLRAPCRALLMAHAAGRLAAGTTIEVVQEFAHVRSRRRPRTDAVALATRYATILPLLTPARDDLMLGLELFAAHEGLDAFDAILAAVVINQQLDGLISPDRAYAAVPGLRWLDPATAVTRLS